MGKKKAQCSSYDLHQAFLSFAVLYKRNFVIFSVVSLTMGNSYYPF